MKRRKFIKGALAMHLLQITGSSFLSFADERISPPLLKRVRPGDAGWPSQEKWNELSKAVNGNLIKLESPLTICKTSPGSEACNNILNELKNPYFLGDEPALTQTSGWLNAWNSSPSTYAVAAKTTADVVAAVNFARENNLRLVVKGGGHSYQGTSNSPDSLLIWTRHMNRIELKDDFVASGCEMKQKPQPAVIIEAGAIWMQAYKAVTTKAGRYVQGGGCATVGVAGLIQSGGFGSFSKKYGLAAAALLEAEIVTADGNVLIVNECNHPDLFWALKGGGGGSFGVITKLILKTRELPEFFGAVLGAIRAKSDDAFQHLIDFVISFYHDHLFNPNWGEQIRLYSRNTVHLNMLFQGLNKEQATTVWKPFQEWVDSHSQDFEWTEPFNVAAIPAQHLWDPGFLSKYASPLIKKDDRPGAPEENIFWKGDGEEAGQFLHAYHSAWLPADLLTAEHQKRLATALFKATRYWGVSLHFNKGLAGAPAEEIAGAKKTATNPAVLNAFALAIIAGGGGPAFEGMPVITDDLNDAKQEAGKMDKAIDELHRLLPHPGSYISESNYFEKNWKQSFWGDNYSKLFAIKKRYDPDGLFFVHHGVGSEEWSDDGFEKI
jgi:FAD/FMN-containing dehydrogenase